MADAKGTDKAVALRYKPEEGDGAPKLVAKGRGDVARKIIELAKEHGVPVQEDPALVELLLRLDLSEEIPPEIYEVVARVLAFVYSLRTEAPK
jgi:flagellar biosynthesis protein